MDYSELLFAAEARKLALEMARFDAPDHLSHEEKDEHVIRNFRKYLGTALSEIEYAARLIKEIKAEKSQ